MKTKIIALAAIVASLTFASAAEKIKAPNGGRIIEGVEPHAEFLVTADKKVEVRFLDASGKVIAPAAQVVTVTMGDRAAPTKLAFAKEGDKLVLNMGPSHPATHGVLRLTIELDGETITKELIAAKVIPAVTA